MLQYNVERRIDWSTSPGASEFRSASTRIGLDLPASVIFRLTVLSCTVEESGVVPRESGASEADARYGYLPALENNFRA